MMQEVEHKEETTNVSVLNPVDGGGDKLQPDSSNATNITMPPMSNINKQDEIGAGEPSQENAGWSLTGWIKSASSNQFVQKVMEKTKTSVDKMITTLDPGMTPFINSGGDISVVVASEKEVKWAAVRDAFQKVFGVATIEGIAAQSNIAAQPVGYASGLKGAQERVQFLRKSGKIDEKQVCVAIESFIVEQLPNHWFDIACLLLDDPINNIKFEVFTLAVPVDGDVVEDMQNSTPSDYDLNQSGFSVTVGETIQKRLSWVKPSDWHKAVTGQSRRDIIYNAALLQAELYKRRLPQPHIEQDI